MLQKNQSSNISKFKFLLIIPLLLLMLTYVACSDDNSIEQSTMEVSKAEHENLVDSYWTELKEMEAKGLSWDKIASTHIPQEPKAEQTKEEYYRFLVFTKWVMESSKERKIKNGTYSESDKKFSARNNERFEITYDEYLQNRKNNKINEPVIIETKEEQTPSVPFALIDKVPAFQECDQWVDDARKNCTSSEISKFVNKNFNTSLGKELGLKGVNRVIVQFRIDENGQVQDIKSRAPHPRLEEEAKRVISELPSFIPGEQNGKPVSVMYSLPIAFKVQ